MSWFDSSFGFAKTAFSQAQKSIDRVLDIEETSGQGVVSNNDRSHDDSTSTNDDSKMNNSNNGIISGSGNTANVSDSFVSTWGSMDSFWGNKSAEQPPIIVKKPTEPGQPTPKRKPKSHSSSIKASTNINTPTSKSDTSIATPTTHDTNRDPPTPINLPVINDLTSTPIIKNEAAIKLNNDRIDGMNDDSLNVESIKNESSEAGNKEKDKMEERERQEENEMKEKEREKDREEESRVLLEKEEQDRRVLLENEKEKERRALLEKEEQDRRVLLEKNREKEKERRALLEKEEQERRVLLEKNREKERRALLEKEEQERRVLLEKNREKERRALLEKEEQERVRLQEEERRVLLEKEEEDKTLVEEQRKKEQEERQRKDEERNEQIETVKLNNNNYNRTDIVISETMTSDIVTTDNELPPVILEEMTANTVVRTEIDNDNTLSVRDNDNTLSVRDNDNTLSVRDNDNTLSVRDNDNTLSVRDNDNTLSVRDNEKGQVDTNDGQHTVAMETELTQVRNLLQIRESKVLEQSEELVTLQQNNQEMQRCLDEFKRQIEKMDDSKDSLTRRVTTAEEKIKTLTRERNSLKKQLQTINNEKSNQETDTTEKRLTELLKEKDEMISSLMEEGEKLSKRELQINNTIKKLRSRDKQNESTITTQKQQIDSFEDEIKKLKEIIRKNNETEQKYQESLAQMNSMMEQQSNEISQLKPERDELQEKARSLQSNLDNVYRELTELRKSKALSQSAVEEATMSAQQLARVSLKKELDEQRLNGEREKDALLLQINELRLNNSRTEQQSTWREDHLKQEISDLHKRIQDSEGRNQDLSDTISDATRPLLRQIEHLRSAHSAQSSNWERLENNLTQRLVEAQSQLNTASEKERSTVETNLTFQSRISSLEEQLTSVRQERTQLMASLETERAKLIALEETHQRESTRHETYRLNVQQNVEELKKGKELLERQLEYERVRLEAESRKADHELQEKEKLRNQLALSLTSIPPLSVSRQSSTSTQDDSLHSFDHRLNSSSVGSDWNSILKVPGGSFGSASGFEHLQTMLKQREGELSNSQAMVVSLERSRSVITEELTQLSASNEALKTQVEKIPEIKQQLLEITQKYDALLQMYGEKVEEAEELRLDIQDLKSLYRQQIEELVNN